VRDEERLQADLRQIPNPVDRQSFAYAQAWKNIKADPLAFVGKGLKESLDLWKPLFGAEERQVSGYTLGRVPAWHLASLLLFDDILYLAILLLAVVGLALAPPQPFKSLTGLWVLLWAAAAFIFFAVTRFRLPVVAVLIPWAGAGIALLASRNALVRVRQASFAQTTASALATLAVLVLVVPAIPVQATDLGIQRWNEQAPYRRAERLFQSGNVSGAIDQYRLANLNVADTRYALAAAVLQSGDSQGALAQLVDNEPEDRFEPFIIRGEAARLAGDLQAASSFFNARRVKVAGDSALEWAWTHLKPPHVDHIDIGSGLDIGYIRGFYTPEATADGTDFRWTTGNAEMRGLSGSASGKASIKVSGWRPGGVAPAVLTITSAGNYRSTKPQTLPNEDKWLGMQTEQPQSGNVIELKVNDFIASGADPRLLGVRVESVTSGP
jgi:hypothetical protein